MQAGQREGRQKGHVLHMDGVGSLEHLGRAPTFRSNRLAGRLSKRIDSAFYRRSLRTSPDSQLNLLEFL
ncbi:Uncharacterized protein APZ42_022128 [Daphnia magna]|uniref:Uncharacterized protein n=1 Tax=Daphnia magna TaxID=35525 RepID=A0A164W1M2_9CRUS|nr:Uncharacterized protein APZ42_022128 [Daphnia magna]